jgi:redox-sensitive bicupin YhaK (pirin superfamily)
MQPAGYEDVAPESIPTLENTGIFVKAIAGETSINGESLKGYFTRPYTLPIILDVRLAPGKTACIALPDTHVAMAYVYDGSATVGSPDDSAGLAKTVTEHGTLSVTSGTGDLVLTNTDNAITTKCIVLAGKPLQESVVQHGPFVMNTAAEIEQAILDYRSGQLTG